MPFITEEIWQAMYEGKPPLKSIALAAYPQADEKQVDLAAETEMAILQDLIVSVRNLRAELKVEPKVKVPIEVFAHEAGDSQDDRAESRRGRAPGECGEDHVCGNFPRQPRRRSRHRALRRARDLRKKIDVAAECERLKKELEKIEKELANNQKQLGNEQFLAKAPAKVVEGLRRRGAGTPRPAREDEE